MYKRAEKYLSDIKIGAKNDGVLFVSGEVNNAVIQDTDAGKKSSYLCSIEEGEHVVFCSKGTYDNTVTIYVGKDLVFQLTPDEPFGGLVESFLRYRKNEWNVLQPVE